MTELGVNRSGEAMAKTRAAVIASLQESVAAAPLPDARVPATAWTYPDGKGFSATSLSGTPTVVVFFRESNCAMTAKTFTEATVAEWKKKGVQVLGVDVGGDTGESMSRCLSSEKIPFRVVRAQRISETTAWLGAENEFGVAFVDRTGSIAAFSSLLPTTDGGLEKRAFARIAARLSGK